MSSVAGRGTGASGSLQAFLRAVSRPVTGAEQGGQIATAAAKTSSGVLFPNSRNTPTVQPVRTAFVTMWYNGKSKGLRVRLHRAYSVIYHRGANIGIEVALLPEEWLIQELPRLYRERPERMHSLLSNLLAEDQELRWSLVIRAYQERQINLGKAAELLELSEIELRDRFLNLGIPLRLGPSDLADAQAEVAAIRAWYREKAKEQVS